ncbi:ARP2/3 complex 21 kDa subunit [Colletotrichum higginsianum]|uniref:ARP2/3 complex 21 kDa subunit n=1 Tax=Colletotrichum higginsianum (strain IMI 349063) TaxID=759273 RepID=H1VAP8_COLHI|nr:ARP2/3 complex 21 kDa subunit [Colletotrichum higginsianum]
MLEVRGERWTSVSSESSPTIRRLLPIRSSTLDLSRFDSHCAASAHSPHTGFILYQTNSLVEKLIKMPAYNSMFNADPNVPRLIGNFPLLPLRTKTRGPAYTLPFPNPPLPANESPDPDSESYEILDEGPADRLLVYPLHSSQHEPAGH